MWQIEDMLRAMNLDIVKVEQLLVNAFQVELEKKREIREWYDNLIAMMKQEKVEEKGHLQVLKNTVNELTELHFYLLHQVHDRRYHQIVTLAASNLIDFRKKAGVDDTVSDVELALNGLYGHLLLRLQKKEVNPETAQAMETFSKMIAYLGACYKQMEEAENTLFEG
jgi:hypothetical protein